MKTTGIKQVKLKFHFDECLALTGIEIDTRNREKKLYIWEKFVSLKKNLDENADFKILWDKEYSLDTNKTVSRIFTQLDNVNIYNTSDWKKVNSFFYKTMSYFEDFFLEYRDYLKHH